MKDHLMLILDEDGVAREYDDAYDIVIHCESKEEQDKVLCALWIKNGGGEGMIRINLNETVKVRLTDLGKKIYYHRFDDLNNKQGRTICEPSFPKVDENGYSTFQLWQFMELYGEHIGIVKPNVIEPLEIVYEQGEDK